MKKLLKWGLIIFVGIPFGFLLIVGTIGSLVGGKSQTSTTTPSPAATQAPTKQEKAVPTPTVTQKPLTITDSLWIALDKSIKSRNGYSVEFDESSKTASVIETKTTAWDESALVRESFTVLVKYGTEAFKIDGVDAVRVVIKTEFTDNYGKKSIADAVRIIMKKSEFNKFDWKSLSYQPVYSQIKNASEGFYIQPAILQKLNPDKLYLAM